MFRVVTILIFVPTLSLIFAPDPVKNSSNSFPEPSPTITSVNESPGGVESLILEKDIVYIICPGDGEFCSEDELKVGVKTLLKDAEKNNLQYYYTVSGGKIIGEGAEVIWDFSKVRPGKYTITASVGIDYVIKAKTVTKTVELQECPVCDRICECPTIRLFGPTKPVKAGELFIVAADVSGGNQERAEYRWKISAGTIVSGQGSTRVMVRSDAAMKDKVLEATLEIRGLCASCPETVSKTFTIE